MGCRYTESFSVTHIHVSIHLWILFPNRLLQTVDRLPLVYIRVLVDYLLNSLLKNMILKAHIIGLKLFNSYHWIFISDFLL